MGSHSNRSEVYLTLTDPSAVKPFKELSSSASSVVIGRASKNDPAAHDPTSGKMRTERTKVMSSSHARVTWKGEQAFIEDTNSTNGVWVRRNDEDPHRLKSGVEYIIKNGDELTFGRRVSEDDKMCEPVVLLAAYTKHAHFAHPTSQTFSEVIPFSQTQSLPLVRSRTLTSRSSEMHNVQIVDIADEEVQPPRRPRFTTFEKRRSGGFGLSEDDLLSTQDEGHDNDITLAIDSVFRPRRRTPPAQAESVSSVAAVSVRSARSSVAPTAEHKLVESGRTTRFGKSSSPELGHPDAIEADVVNLVDEIEGKSHRVETSRLPSPNSPEERRRSRSASRQSTGGAKIVNQLQPKQRRKSTLDDDSLYWSDASAVVEPPVGLFSRPIHSAQTIDLSDDDDNDVFEHPGSQLPSPVISASASEEPEPAPASRYVPLECYDALQDFATGDAEDLEAAPVRASTPVREDFDLPATSPLSKSLAAFLDEADVQDRLLRDAETRSPPLSQALPSSPLSKSLAAFVDDSEEHDRLIRDAETRSPASSQDPASDVAEPEADDEETLDKNDIQFLGCTSRTSEKCKSSPSTSISSRTTPSSRPPRSTSTIEDDDVWSLSFPRSAGKAKVDPPSPFLAASYDDEDELSDLASLSELDVSDIEADETDPDLDEVDLDLDTSVADDVDSGEESGEVDEHDGIGAEEERWEDGVSEMLVEVETVSFVEEATQAVADEAMDTLAVVFKRKPGGEEVEEKVEQEVVQKGSVQTEKVPVDLGDDGYAAEREVMRQFLEKGRRSSAVRPATLNAPTSPKETSIDFASAPISSPRKRRLSETDLEEQTTQPEVEKESQSIETELQALVGTEADELEKATPVIVVKVERPTKRLRLGFSVKTLAVGFLTGAVAAVGGLSALGAYLEE